MKAKATTIAPTILKMKVNFIFPWLLIEVYGQIIKNIIE